MDDCLRWAAARARAGEFPAGYVHGERPWEYGLPQEHRGPTGTRRRIWEASICSGEPLRRTAFFGYDGMQFQGQIEVIASPSACGLALHAIRDMYKNTEFLFVSHPDVQEPVFRVVLPSGRVMAGEMRPTEDVATTRRETLDRSTATARMLGLTESASDAMWRHWNPANYSSMTLVAMEVSMRIHPPGPRRNGRSSRDRVSPGESLREAPLDMGHGHDRYEPEPLYIRWSDRQRLMVPCPTCDAQRDAWCRVGKREAVSLHYDRRPEVQLVTRDSRGRELSLDAYLKVSEKLLSDDPDTSAPGVLIPWSDDFRLSHIRPSDVDPVGHDEAFRGSGGPWERSGGGWRKGKSRNGEINEDDLRVICGGCGKHLKGRPDAPLISHGLCPGSMECWELGVEKQRKKRAKMAEDEQRDALKNPFLRKPEGKHHGPVAGGVHPYPGFHTASDMDVTAPYAQMKGVDEVDAPDDECEECEGDGCPECVSLYSTPDYPVVIGVDMQGLKPEPDYDAIHLSLDALRVVAGEALGSGEDPLQWLDSIEGLDPDEPPDSVEGMLFHRFTTCVMDPGRCLLSVLEDLPPEEVEQSLKEIVKGGKKAKRLAMKVVGQFRYTQDVPDDRLVSVAYMKPFWPHGVLDVDESEEMVEALVAAGWDPITRDDADTFDPEFKTVWKARKGPGARVEYHGTSYRNLLLAAPWLAAELPVPPAPFKADA